MRERSSAWHRSSPTPSRNSAAGRVETALLRTPTPFQMAQLTEDQARAYMHKLLGTMLQAGGSDLFISDNFPPTMKAHGAMTQLSQQRLTGEITRVFAYSIMNERQREEFAKDMECNFAIAIPGLSRFRVN